MSLIGRALVVGVAGAGSGLVLATVALAVVPASATYQATRTKAGERVSARVTLENGRAELETLGRGVRVRCSNGEEIMFTLDAGDVTVTVRDDGTFSRRRTVRFSTRATGAATARETFTGRVVGGRARLRASTSIDGSRADCRKTAEWSLRDLDAGS